MICTSLETDNHPRISSLNFDRMDPIHWRRGVVASVVRRMNEVTLRRARLVLGWAGIPSWYVTSQLGQLSLASLRGR